MNYQSIIDFIHSLYPGQDFVPLHEPFFGGHEKEYLLNCIDSTFVSSVGKYVDRFEDMIREYTGANYAVATVNGTAALHVALLMAGVKRNDLVITQPLTFIATCNAISYCGAEPVFLDIDRKTLGLSADALEEWLRENVDVVDKGLEGRESLEGLEGSGMRLPSQPSQQRSVKPSQPSLPQALSIHKSSGKRISACVPMHTFGHPCEIDRIVEICDRYHIPVVEDSAESLGSFYQEKHTGTIGRLGIFSFNGNKTITTGGGGMIITDDADLGKLAKHITTTAKMPHPWSFEHNMTAYNYRLPNVNAALGCAQMEQLSGFLADKRATAQAYQEFFGGYPGCEFVGEPQGCKSNYWLNAILLPDQDSREEFLELSNQVGVMTRPAWTLMNELPMFKDSVSDRLDCAREIGSRLVNLPSGVRMKRMEKT